MNKQQKEPWQIAAARYCLNNAEEGFTVDDLKTYIKQSYNVHESHITFFFNEEIFSPQGRQYSRSSVDGKWTPPLDLVSKVIDYDELKEARKNAKNAFILSIIAIIISVVTLIVTLFK